MNELAALFEGQIGQEIWLMMKMLTSAREVEPSTPKPEQKPSHLRLATVDGKTIEP